MSNPETQATLDTRHKTKTDNSKTNKQRQTTKRTENMNNVDPTEILEVDLCGPNRNTGGGLMCSPTKILEVDLCVRQPKYWRWTFTLLLIVRSCMSLTADLGYFE